MKSTLALGSLATLIVVAAVWVWAPWESDSPLSTEADQAGAHSEDSSSAKDRSASGKDRGSSAGQDREVVGLETEWSLQLPVKVQTDSGFEVPGARIGFDFAAPKVSGPPQRQARTDDDGVALFQFKEADFAGREIAMCTVAMLVPSDPPQVQEIRADRLALTPVHFTRPITGQLNVIVTNADGRPLPDGTLVYLQLAGPAFSPQLGRCVTTATTENGEADFPYVGIDTDLTIAVKNADEESGFSTLDIHGPSEQDEQIHAELILPGPVPVIQVLATGEGGVASANQKLVGELTYRKAGRYSGDFNFQTQLDKEGVAEVEFPRELVRADAALLATRVMSQSEADPAELRLGLRLLYHKTLGGQFQKWLVHHGDDLLVGGRILDQNGDPFPGGQLTFSVRENDIKQSNKLGMSWILHADAAGRFQIYAPTLPGLDYSLGCSSYRSRSHFLDFVPGTKDKDFTVLLPPIFLGRVLVDDPSLLAELTFDPSAHLRKETDKYVPWRILQADGNFELRGRHKGRLLRSLYLKTTGEKIPGEVYDWSMPKREGNRWRYADWDLRGKLFKHELVVKNENGGSVGEVSYLFPGIEGGRRITADARLDFLSIHAQVPILINADGYREQKVMSNGKADVLLTKGIPLQVNFDPPLPMEYGVQWRILLVNEAYSRDPEQWKWRKVRGKVAHLSLPISGNWKFYLAATPAGDDPATSVDHADVSPSSAAFEGLLDEDGQSFKVFNRDLEIKVSFSAAQYAHAVELMREQAILVHRRLRD